MMKPLPIELWFQIAELLHPQDIYKLVSVNRVFFDMIMNEVYEQLSFITSDPHIFSDKLRALQSPSLTERVRVLTIWPSAVRDAIKAVDHEKTRNENEPERASTPKPMILQKVGGLFGHAKSMSMSRPMTPPRSHAPLPSPQERMDMFINVIRALIHVEELQINWYLDNGSRSSAWKVPFFPEIWSCLGHNLQKLSIDIQVFKLNDIVKSCGLMPNVEELILTLRCDAALGHPGDTAVPYFINKFAPTLRVLSVKTIGHQELSTNFQLLGYFPRLTKLSVIMPLDSQHLQDPTGFQQFLHNHPAIRELCVHYSQCCKECVDDGFKTYDGRHRLYSGVTLPVLQSLELGLRIPIPHDHTSPMLNSIARLGKDLNSLTLTDRSLTLAEVKIVLRFFPTYRLRRLSLFAQFLSPQLIDLIAQTCPDLNSLSLDVQTVVRSEMEAAEKPSVDNIAGFAEALSNYAVDLENDRWRYRTWTLADISVMKWEFKIGHTYNQECMNAIALVVPSVRSFAGRGHMGAYDNLPRPGTQRLLVDLEHRQKPFDT